MDIMKIFEETAYVRMGGSAEELRCAEYLKQQCADMGLEAIIEDFPVQMADIQEAILVVDGKEIPMKDDKEDYLKPWRFTSDDGRFELDFVPVIDRSSCTDFKILKSDQHQVFGLFSGKAVLDDGKVIEIKDFFGFAEKVKNKW